MKTLEKGFTLIELVVVITILGILAAFALPRFAGLETSARIASLNGVLGSAKAAASLAHSVALVNGTTASESITMEGQTVTMAFFYPTADSGGIVAAMQDSSAFTPTGSLTFELVGAPTPANCSFSYTAATSTSAPSFSSPTVGGC